MLKIPELPEKIIVEEIVKNGAMEGIINVSFAGHIYTITVIEVKEAFSKKVTCFIDTGKKKCVILENGFNKVIHLNRDQILNTS
ncbi:MAG: hypothetical protein KAU07_03905 [Candidatus Andersenbacteria bacterium]|nr:hypothetical protein [Candidatus Andersenbacteria bacterium]